MEASRPDLTYEGVGFYEDRTQRTEATAPSSRFFDTVHGTHLYTSDETERASILQSSAGSDIGRRRFLCASWLNKEARYGVC